jgi:hypothetical protein
MVIGLFLFSLAFLILRIIYVNLSRSKELGHTIIKLFGDTQSITYFFPLRHFDSDEIRIRRLKKIANLFLYLFFISFFILIF